jgi:hypothetical protein
MSDTIIDEVRRVRDEYAKQFNYDLHAMCLDLRREQSLAGVPVVSFAAKRTPKDLPKQCDQSDTKKASAVAPVSQPKS